MRTTKWLITIGELQSEEMAVLQAEIAELKKLLNNIKRHLLAIISDL